MTDETLLDKLIIIQNELKAPKARQNLFGKYAYRSCEDILKAVKPVATKQGCLVTLTDEIVFIGDRYYVKATATLTDGTTTVTTTGFAREEADKKGMDQSQITGASSSYARKYALNGLLAIDDAKDSDKTNKEVKPFDTKVAYTKDALMAEGEPLAKIKGTDESTREQRAWIIKANQYSGYDVLKTNKRLVEKYGTAMVSKDQAVEVINTQLENLAKL